MRSNDELRVWKICLQELTELFAMLGINRHNHIVENCEREIGTQDPLHQGEVEAHPHSVLMAFAVICAGREHAFLMEVHQEPKLPVHRFKLSLELPLIIMVDELIVFPKSPSTSA